MRARLQPLLAAIALVATPLASGGLRAQDGSPTGPWSLRTRMVVTGLSHHSDPPGYTVYSAIALETGVTRAITSILSLELSVRTESREIDQAAPSGPDYRLGSVELLPLTLMLQARPVGGRALQPYFGAGVCFTAAWEKSGVLDSTDIGAVIGPAVQAGVDIALSPAALLNIDARWNALAMDVKLGGSRLARLEIDPVVLGAGVGFRF